MDFKNELKNSYFKIMAVFLLFLLLAFNQELAMVYILIMFSDWIWTVSDSNISFPIARSTNSGFQMILEGLVGFGSFLAISTVLQSAFSPSTIVSTSITSGVQSIFQLLSTTVPRLADSDILTFVAWGVVVPIIETSFWNGRLLEGLSTYAEFITGKRISLQNYSIQLMVVMFVVAGLFTLFHITSKGIDSVPLMITFIFSIISSILVIRHQELRSAILVHILTNSAAVGVTLKWF